MYIGTIAEEVAVLRSHLQSLYKWVNSDENAGNLSLQHVSAELEVCCEQCQSVFDKLREEKREHIQKIQLEQKQSKLKSELSRFNELSTSMFTYIRILIVMFVKQRSGQHPLAKRRKPNGNQFYMIRALRPGSGLKDWCL